MNATVKEVSDGEYIVMLHSFKEGELRMLADLQETELGDSTRHARCTAMLQTIADSLYIAHAVPLDEDEEYV